MSRCKWSGTPVLALLAFLVGFTTAPIRAQGPESMSPSVVLILDASGSMWEQLAGGYKICIAQAALKNLATELSDDM